MRFGEYIRAERMRQGVSGNQLADKAGFDRQQVYQWEKGERGITLNNAIRLLKALDAVVLVGAGGVIS